MRNYDLKGRWPANERLRALSDYLGIVEIALGQFLPDIFKAIGRMELAQVNLPVGVLNWVMIIPMLVNVDFAALHDSIMVIAFAPLVGLLLGISAITVPWETLITSAVLNIVIPVILAQVAAGQGTSTLPCRNGKDWSMVDYRITVDTGGSVRLPG